MEGIFDFGMAGIRKGLRLTGLQEESKNKKSGVAASVKKLPKWPQIVQDDSKSDDNVWINPLTSPNFEGEILLVGGDFLRAIFALIRLFFRVGKITYV